MSAARPTPLYIDSATDAGTRGEHLTEDSENAGQMSDLTYQALRARLMWENNILRRRGIEKLGSTTPRTQLTRNRAREAHFCITDSTSPLYLICPAPYGVDRVPRRSVTRQDDWKRQCALAGAVHLTPIESEEGSGRGDPPHARPSSGPGAIAHQWTTRKVDSAPRTWRLAIGIRRKLRHIGTQYHKRRPPSRRSFTANTTSMTLGSMPQTGGLGPPARVRTEGPVQSERLGRPNIKPNRPNTPSSEGACFKVRKSGGLEIAFQQHNAGSERWGQLNDEALSFEDILSMLLPETGLLKVDTSESLYGLKGYDIVMIKSSFLYSANKTQFRRRA
ncbi:hypothetical protein FB451DRAFT_1180186 [Mycena latifolia]|nr:hypothetical protein FB451DRAFT_1180186 [Mycena latifolia]